MSAEPSEDDKQSPGRLETARRRLEQAVVRLERAAEAGPQQEAVRLRETLHALRAEHDALQEITKTVRGRLDGTIRRLESILEE